MKLFTFLIAICFTFSVNAQDLNTFLSKTNTFLGEHVKNGKVDYSGIKKDPSALNELIKMAEGISVKTSDAKNYQAFWINAYNLNVINGIIDVYPTKSPLDTKGIF